VENSFKDCLLCLTGAFLPATMVLMVKPYIKNCKVFCLVFGRTLKTESACLRLMAGLVLMPLLW
jgi:hypothetical protein